jgi:hypothetical protein
MTTPEDHAWQMKQSLVTKEMLDKPLFCVDALRKMVASCVALHPSGSSLYTDGERKVMLAAVEHIENFVSLSQAERADP